MLARLNKVKLQTHYTEMNMPDLAQADFRSVHEIRAALLAIMDDNLLPSKRGQRSVLICQDPTCNVLHYQKVCPTFLTFISTDTLAPLLPQPKILITESRPEKCSQERHSVHP